MSFNSKYSGQQVENLLDQVASGNAGGSGGGITTEIDPIFSASPSAKITDGDIEEWNNKQDVISDLESIRNNASKGAQALDAIPTKVSQLENDEGYLTSHQDISGLATKDELQGKVDKVDGKQLSTEDFTTLLKQKLDGLSNYDDTEISQAVSKLRTDLDTLVGGDTTTAIKTFNEVIAFLDGIEDSESLDAIIASIEQQIAAKGTYTKPSNGIPKSDLASDVQTSLGKADTALQSVPSEYVTETELNNKGYATSSQLNTGFADAERKFAALNEEMDNKQPILVSGTNIKTINGTSILGSGDIVIEGGSGDSSEEVYVWYLDNVSEGTISLQVYEKLKTVKTIIGVINSKFYHASSRLVFRGNIVGLTLSTIYTNMVISYNFSFHEIEDGYDYISELYSYAIIENYIRVEHGTSDTTFTLTPNTFHVWDEVAALDLSFADEQAGVANEYTFQFTSGATPTSLTLPDTIQWVNGAPNIEANKTYQVSIVNNIGLIVSV